MSEATLQQLLSRLDAVTSRLEAVESKIAGGGSSAGGSSAGTAESGARYVQDFDALVSDTVTPFVAQTQKIGNAELKKQVGLFQQAVVEHRKFLNVAAQSKQPSNDVLVKLLEPINKLVSEIIAIRDANRPNPQFNWLSTISEAVPAFAWVTVSPTPGPFVTEYRGNSQFYSNKILREFRGKDEEQVKWVNLFTEFMTGLIDYIKKHHTTGCSWNASGGDASKFAGSGAGSGPAPPPPQPTTPLSAAPSKPAAGGSGGANALFASINAAGGGITSGLKKVTKDMKTKYRPPEERSAVVPAGAVKKPSSAPKYGSKAPAKSMPPKLALEGNKWVVEFQEGNKNVVIENPEVKHVVYLYRCNNSVIQIKGKVNAITVDECKRTGIVFTDAIATCEVVNSQSIEIQCTGRVPNFAIDKTSGVQLYLGKAGLDTEIVTSKTDQFNVLIPKGDDLEELSVPEQFKTVIQEGKLVTTHVEHA